MAPIKRLMVVHIAWVLSLIACVRAERVQTLNVEGSSVPKSPANVIAHVRQDVPEEKAKASLSSCPSCDSWKKDMHLRLLKSCPTLARKSALRSRWKQIYELCPDWRDLLFVRKQGDGTDLLKEVAVLEKLKKKGIRAVNAVSTNMANRVGQKVVGMVEPRLDGVFVDVHKLGAAAGMALVMGFLEGAKFTEFGASKMADRLRSLLAPVVDGSQADIKYNWDAGKYANYVADANAILKNGKGKRVNDLQGILSLDGHFTIIDPLGFRKYPPGDISKAIADAYGQLSWSLDFLKELYTRHLKAVGKKME